ncbi:MAG: hypothetical protein NC293_12245 [Roseburia sp.]|nr:hypothetical protein [Roseburia sp.]
MKEWIGNMAGIISGHVVLNYIWGLCLSASVMILFLFLIRPFMKRLPRIAMYLLWILVVIRIVCPFSVNGIYGLFPERVAETVVQTRQSVMPEQISMRLEQTPEESFGGVGNGYRLKPETDKLLGDNGAGTEAAGNRTNAVGNNGNSQNFSRDYGFDKILGKSAREGAAGSISAKTPEEAARIQEEREQLTAATVMMAVWVMGVLFCVLYLLCSLIMNRRMFRHAVHLFDNVYEHPYACSSFVGNIISPKIYVPKGMCEADLECILVHEKTHIRRQDYRIKPLAFLVFSLLWFNPLVWAAYHFMMRDMEISCDEMVMRKLGSDARKRYSYLLLAMASGENGILCPNTAFGAGAVNERIHHVMRYRRPTKFITAAAVLAVALCGCGISSTPQAEQAEATPMPEKEETVYVEQTVSRIRKDWSEYVPGKKEPMVAEIADAVDSQGNLINFFEVQTRKYEHICIVKALYQEEDWNFEEVKWDKDVLGEKKNAEIRDVFYGADGFLYAAVCQMSMSEKEASKGGEQNEEDYYVTKQLLYRINEETGECTELEVPQTPAKEVLGADAKGIVTNQYSVFADGSYIAFDGVSVYNGLTGEKKKIDSLNFKERMGYILTGDDFICWWRYDQQEKQIKVQVCDETLKETYVLASGVAYGGGEELVNITLGAKGNTILMATDEGIFEAEYGEDEFRRIAGQETDNLYYLSPDSYTPESHVFKGEQQDYYLYLANDNTGDSVWCHYVKKEQ